MKKLVFALLGVLLFLSPTKTLSQQDEPAIILPDLTVDAYCYYASLSYGFVIERCEICAFGNICHTEVDIFWDPFFF